jgi:predicted metalloprotease with PDZ domain
MKKYTSILLFLLAGFAYSFASQSGYVYTLDLTHVVAENKLRVELSPPPIQTDQSTFYIPKIVPGTYEIYDFGRFVSEFQATDGQGKELVVDHPDVNSWVIHDSRRLAKVSYLVESSWTSKAGAPIVFEPAGTNIEAGKNFVLNNHGFFGFFGGMKKVDFELDIIRPAGFYGSTSLMDVHTSGNTDTYHVSDYTKLADAPIMYCMPDTTTIHIGGASVLISSYSPTQKVSAAFISENIAEILKAQKEYLGGLLPIKKYAFIFYFTNKATLSGNNGALEHNLSSFYVLPEIKQEYLKQTLRDVAAHEFFHIVTPLSIHSEEIADFDFMVPKMSEHLWLYEGMTEYSAGLVQIKYGIIDVPAYVGMLHEKLVAASKFNDRMSFTEMSRHVVEKKYHDQYNNVYEKGALIGMCLDMELRKLSDGKYGIQDMLHDLSKTYGSEKAFRDEELFGVITRLTYPEIGDFLKKYVEGGDPLPFKELFSLAGFDYESKQTLKGITLGSFELGYDTLTKHFYVAGTEGLDAFGKKMDYKKGDQILKLNGVDLTMENARQLIPQYATDVKVGDVVRIEVMRKNQRGRYRKKMLHAKLVEVETIETNVLIPIEPELMTEKQKKFRKDWINQ